MSVLPSARYDIYYHAALQAPSAQPSRQYLYISTISSKLNWDHLMSLCLSSGLKDTAKRSSWFSFSLPLKIA